MSTRPQRLGFGEGQAECSSSDALQHCKHTALSQWPVPDPRHRTTPPPRNSTTMQVFAVRHTITGLHFRHLLSVASKQREGTSEEFNSMLQMSFPPLEEHVLLSLPRSQASLGVVSKTRSKLNNTEMGKKRQ